MTLASPKTPARERVIEALRQGPGALTIGGLLGAAQVRRQSLFRILNELVAEGCVGKGQQRLRASDGLERVLSVYRWTERASEAGSCPIAPGSLKGTDLGLPSGGLGVDPGCPGCTQNWTGPGYCDGCAEPPGWHP